MADLHIKELEEKVAHYEAIMSRCPQCKTSLPAPEAESTTASSRHTRSSHSVQQSAVKVPPPALAGPSKRSALASTLSSPAQSSKQLHPASRRELQASNLQEHTPSTAPAALSNRSNQSTEASVSTLQHPSINSSDQSTSRSVTFSAADSSGIPITSSRTPSTRPSSPALSTADGRHPHSGKLVYLDLPQQYKKPRSRTLSGRPPGESPRHAEWMRTADIMLEEVPSGKHWQDKVKRMDSSVLAAVAMGAGPVPNGGLSPIEDIERKELIRLVRRFAERHSEGRVNFEQFILVCLCKVLSSQGVPQDKIVETLQICISDTSKGNIERYLKGATWTNKMMDELFFANWGYRAVDLIVIWNRTVATYGKIAAAPGSRQYFITDLTQRKYFEGYQEVPHRRHDTIPWLVKKELGDKVSYRDICEALGYSDEFFIKTKDLHSSNPTSPELNADDSDRAGSTSWSGTFHTSRQSTISPSSLQRPSSVEETPSNYPFNASYLQELSLRRRQLHQNDSFDDAAGRDPPTRQSVGSQRMKRLVPDRFAKPLGDSDAGRRQRKPYETPSFAELPSTSLGESAPGTQSAKRPLPESPTSAFQPIDSSRRRQHVGSRVETGTPSRPEKKGSKDQRSRA